MKDTNERPPYAQAETVREQAERSRLSAEQDRQRAEGEREVAEKARVASEGERAQLVESVAEVADTLQATLTQMKVVEDLRRTPHERPDESRRRH